MYTIFSDMKKREEFIKTPNFSEATLAARTFYRTGGNPAYIWKDMELIYLYYDYTLYQKIDGGL